MIDVDVLGYIAAGLVLAAFCMESMAVLRIIAVASNIAFIAYAIGKGLMPVFALHVVLLPINLYRLVQLHSTKGMRLRGPSGAVDAPSGTITAIKRDHGGQ